MHAGGRRAIGALALLFVLLLGGTALLPFGALGQATQINGEVSTCLTTIPFVSGATVTLIDANGISKPSTTTTKGDGVYAFVNPPTGSYTVAVNRSGYYGSATTDPQRYDGSGTVSIDLCMDAFPTPSKVLTANVVAGGAPVAGAVVAAYNTSNPTGRTQLVATATTNAAGYANLTLWSAPFQLRTSAANYQTDESPVDLRTTSTKTISLVAGFPIFGHAKDPRGNFLGDGLVGWLFDPDAPETSAYRLIPAVVNSSLFEFHAPAGMYEIIIDADGSTAHRESITLPGTGPLYDVELQPSPREVYDTKFAYIGQEWNNLTAWRNLTLNADSTLTGLGPSDLRDLRLQIDATLGNRDGMLDSGEITIFRTWIESKGPAYVTTDGFLTTNGKTHNSTTWGVSVFGLENPGGKVWINATASYVLKVAPPYIASGAKTYAVNVTMVPDQNVSAYQDFVYTVAFPKGYELGTSTFLPGNAPLTIKSYAPATVDPGVMSDKVQIRMDVSESLTGTARAKIISPIGKFHVQNATDTNYQAFAANDTTLTFSAEDSTDPNGHIEDANFTWQFTTNALDKGYDIRTSFKYVQSATYIVNLTVRETGGNLTYRNITVFVDDQLPIARIWTNRTGSASANGRILSVNDEAAVKFDGGRLSSDLAYPDKPGVILDGGYSWDFNGDRIADATGRVVDHTFRTPGNFTVNLTVTDSVGWKSLNASMTVSVNDTMAPSPAFDILDPLNEWATIESPMERKTYAFNASRTTDDFEKNISKLNFTWTIPGPVVERPLEGLNHTFYGVNITFTWQEWNASYNVILSVKDPGFGSMKPNTGNLTRSITVQIDVSLHADLRIDAGTMKVEPGDPEEGALVTVRVNVTNKANRAAAGNITAQLLAISGGQTTIVTSLRPGAIPSGQTVQIVLQGTLSGQGNKTLQVYVFDSSEPYTWVTAENRISMPVNVRQPWWQPYAVWGSVIGVIALFVGGMYARRKIKAGEWRPIRGRREKAGEEKEKPRREIKEEKKRL